MVLKEFIPSLLVTRASIAACARSVTSQHRLSAERVAKHSPRPTAASPEAHGRAEASAGGPPAIPHSLDGRDNCLACHAAGGLKPYPADHEGRTVDQCQMCHQPAEAVAPAATAEPEATTVPTTASQPATPEPTATTAASPSGGIPAVPHPLEGREDCVLCHGEGGVKPYPADHVGRTSDTCLQCHQPIAAGEFRIDRRRRRQHRQRTGDPACGCRPGRPVSHLPLHRQHQAIPQQPRGVL